MVQVKIMLRSVSYFPNILIARKPTDNCNKMLYVKFSTNAIKIDQLSHYKYTERKWNDVPTNQRMYDNKELGNK